MFCRTIMTNVLGQIEQCEVPQGLAEGSVVGVGVAAPGGGVVLGAGVLVLAEADQFGGLGFADGGTAAVAEVDVAGGGAELGVRVDEFPVP